MSPCGRAVTAATSQLRPGDGFWSPDHCRGPCGLTIDLKRGKKKGNCLAVVLLLLRGQICLLAALCP